MVKAKTYFPCQYENLSSASEILVDNTGFQIFTILFHELVVTFNETLMANKKNHINYGMILFVD